MKWLILRFSSRYMYSALKRYVFRRRAPIGNGNERDERRGGLCHRCTLFTWAAIREKNRIRCHYPDQNCCRVSPSRPVLYFAALCQKPQTIKKVHVRSTPPSGFDGLHLARSAVPTIVTASDHVVARPLKVTLTLAQAAPANNLCKCSWWSNAMAKTNDESSADGRRYRKASFMTGRRYNIYIIVGCYQKHLKLDRKPNQHQSIEKASVHLLSTSDRVATSIFH